MTLGAGGRMGAADAAALVFPQTLVIHSVPASFRGLLLRYTRTMMTLKLSIADKHIKAVTLLHILSFFFSISVETSCPHQVGVKADTIVWLLAAMVNINHTLTVFDVCDANLRVFE